MKKSEQTTFANENVRIRKYLQDIVEEAYKDELDADMLKKCITFWFELKNKELKSRAGAYYPAQKKIEITNLGRSGKHVAITCIHKLTHHIDHCLRGASDHSEKFYEIYRKLLYAALNMRIVVPEDVSCLSDVSDSNKVKIMIAEWTPQYVVYGDDKSVIKVMNGFSLKDELKQRGYTYHSSDSSWRKTLDKHLIPDEKVILENLINKSAASSVEIIIEDSAVMMAPELKVEITVKGNTFPHKDILKELGFYFKNKNWLKKMPYSTDAEKEEVNKLLSECKEKAPGLEFKIK